MLAELRERDATGEIADVLAALDSVSEDEPRDGHPRPDDRERVAGF